MKAKCSLWMHCKHRIASQHLMRPLCLARVVSRRAQEDPDGWSLISQADKADGSKLAKKRRRNFDGLGGGGRTEGEGKNGAFGKGEVPGKGGSKGGIGGGPGSKGGQVRTKKPGGGKKAGRT